MELVHISDTDFEDVYYEWVENLCTSVSELHQNGSYEFARTLRMYLPVDYIFPRSELVLRDVKKMLRKFKKSDIDTVLIGYDTSFLEPSVLSLILEEIGSRKAFKDIKLTQINAENLTKSVDYYLHYSSKIPDLIFVVMHLHQN